MEIASGSKHSVHYVQETEYGVIPANPTLKPLCITSDNLGMTKDGIEAGKLNDSRQVVDLRHGNRQVGGDLEAELEYGTFDDFLEAVLMGSWSSNVLKVGTTRRSYTLQRRFDLDINEFHRYTGCEVNTFNISLQPNSMVNISFGIVGKDLDSNRLTSEITGTTYTTIPNETPFDNYQGEILVDGVENQVVTALEITLENGIEPNFVLFDPTGVQPSDGKSRVTGTLTSYFTSSALYNKFLNEENAALEFTLENPQGDQLRFEMPNIKFSGGNPDVSGDGPVTVAMEFTALYDETQQTQLLIERIEA